MINISIQQKYFDAIKSGRKTVEGRLNSTKFQNLKVAMPITFISTTTKQQLTCIVQAIHTYPDFKAMLQSEGVQKMLPDINNLEDAVSIYESFPGYKEEVKKIGALAIRITLID